MGRLYFNDYLVFNTSNQFSEYGYIYYASLYSSPSYTYQALLILLAISGIVSNFVLLLNHLCAICFAQKHLYKKWPISSLSITRHSKRPFKQRFRSTISKVCLFVSRCASSLFAKVFCRTESTVLPTNVQVTTSVSSATIETPPVKLNIQNDCVLYPHCYSVFPRVAIIKPLAGVDANLEINLVSYFQLDYPNYEILFCVTNINDPACDIVRNLIQRYPHVNSKLIFPKTMVGVNPKINNLQAGYEATQAELLFISDSGVWILPTTLTDMVATLNSEPDIGLVHQIPFLVPHSNYTNCSNISSQLHCDFRQSSGAPEVSRPSFAWLVQLIFFGCWHAKIYLCAAYWEILCVTGMSCLMRKSSLDKLGGFKHFGSYLAEDFFLGKYFIDEGLRIRISHQPVWQNSPSANLSQFAERLNRWAHLRMSMILPAYLLEPFSRCLPNAALGAFSFAYFFPSVIDGGVYFLCYILIWFLLDYLLLILMYPPCLPLCITKLEYLVAWVFSELVAVPFHFTTFFQRELVWRNNRFRVQWGGRSYLIAPAFVSSKHSGDLPMNEAANNTDICLV